MAENKKSVLLYCDIIHTVKSLTDEEAGKLFKHYLHYINDLNPESDRLTELVFEPIKQNLKRDLLKWDKIKNKRSDAGKVSAEKRKQNPTNSTHVENAEQSSTNSTHVENAEQSSTNSTVKDNVNVNVNVNDNVKVKDIKTKNKQEDFDFDFMATSFSPAFVRFLDYRKKIHKEFKTQMSVEACYRNLVELSCNDPTVAESIVERSIANQWQGLFELKEKNSAKKENNYGKQSTNDRTNRVESVSNLKNNSEAILDYYAAKNSTASD